MALPPLSLKDPCFIRPEPVSEHLADWSYLAKWLHRMMLNQRDLQGQTLKTYLQISQKIKNPSDNTVQIACSATEAEFFKIIFQQASHIRQISISPRMFTVELNRSVKEEPIFFTHPRREEKSIEIEQIKSRAVRFVEPEPMNYSAVFQKVLQQIYDAIFANQSHLHIDLHGVDCLFFAHILRKFYRFCIHVVILDQNYRLHIHVKTPESRKPLLDELKESMGKFKKFALISPQKPKSAPFDKTKRLKKFSLTLPNDPKAVQFGDFSEKSFSSQNCISYSSVPLAFFLSDNHYSIAEDSINLEAERKNKACCLASTYLAYCLQHLFHTIQLNREQWNEVWKHLNQTERDQLWKRIDPGLRNTLWQQIDPQEKINFLKRIMQDQWIELWEQLAPELRSQLWKPVDPELGDQLWAQVDPVQQKKLFKHVQRNQWENLWEKLTAAQWDSLWEQIDPEQWGTLLKQISSEQWEEGWDSIESAPSNELKEQIHQKQRDHLWKQVAPEHQERFLQQISQNNWDVFWEQLNPKQWDTLWAQIDLEQWNLTLKRLPPEILEMLWRQLNPEQWDKLWEPIHASLPKHPSYKQKEIQRDIQELAILKSALEHRKLHPLESATAEQLKKTDLYQTMRTYFPDVSERPIVSVWINNTLLQVKEHIDPPKVPPRTYFLQVLESLARDQKNHGQDEITLAHTLLYIKEKTQLHLSHQKDEEIIRMLQAASFSLQLEILRKQLSLEKWEKLWEQIHAWIYFQTFVKFIAHDPEWNGQNCSLLTRAFLQLKEKERRDIVNPKQAEIIEILQTDSFASQLKILQRQLNPEQWCKLWNQMHQDLSEHPLYKQEALEQSIRQLAILKNSIEQRALYPDQANAEWPENKDFCQMMRECFPETSKMPVLSIWVNHAPFLLEESANIPNHSRWIYCHQFVQSLAHNLKMEEEDCSILTHALLCIENEGRIELKNPKSELIVRMLQSTSFSFSAHAYFSLKDKIAPALFEEYEIKPSSSENITCEFFVPKKGGGDCNSNGCLYYSG